MPSNPWWVLTIVASNSAGRGHRPGRWGNDEVRPPPGRRPDIARRWTMHRSRSHRRPPPRLAAQAEPAVKAPPCDDQGAGPDGSYSRPQRPAAPLSSTGRPNAYRSRARRLGQRLVFGFSFERRLQVCHAYSRVSAGCLAALELKMCVSTPALPWLALPSWWRPAGGRGPGLRPPRPGTSAGSHPMRRHVRSELPPLPAGARHWRHFPGSCDRTFTLPGGSPLALIVR